MYIQYFQKKSDTLFLVDFLFYIIEYKLIFQLEQVNIFLIISLIIVEYYITLYLF